MDKPTRCTRRVKHPNEEEIVTINYPTNILWAQLQSGFETRKLKKVTLEFDTGSIISYEEISVNNERKK